MSKISLTDRIIIKGFGMARKLYTGIYGCPELKEPSCCNDARLVNDRIYGLLTADRPCMIGRFGYYELECTVFANNRLYHHYDLWNYARCKSDIWWYPDEIVRRMQYNAGFFTPTMQQLDRFGDEMIAAMPLLDVLGSWKKEESLFMDRLSNAMFVNLELLNPLWGSGYHPWSMALEDKKVLVVHPFAETIRSQYANREQIHRDARVLPQFHLKTIKAVQAITGTKPEGFSTWFDALHYMEDEIDKTDYDVCIVGCGAYGFLLAAHCKRMGRKAVHLGGATQLLFGIKGKRWENPDYGFNGVSYQSFMTPQWVRPSTEETPAKSSDIEGGCYW